MQAMQEPQQAIKLGHNSATQPNVNEENQTHAATHPVMKVGNGSMYHICLNVAGAILVSTFATLFLRDKSLHLDKNSLLQPLPLAILVIGVAIISVNAYFSHQKEHDAFPLDEMIPETKEALYRAIRERDTVQAVQLVKKYTQLHEDKWTRESAPIIAMLSKDDPAGLQENKMYCFAKDQVALMETHLSTMAGKRNPKYFSVALQLYDETLQQRLNTLMGLKLARDRTHHHTLLTC